MLVGVTETVLDCEVVGDIDIDWELVKELEAEPEREVVGELEGEAEGERDTEIVGVAENDGVLVKVGVSP